MTPPLHALIAKWRQHEVPADRDDARRQGITPESIGWADGQEQCADELEAALPEPPSCEFCDSSEYLMDVCTACWNRANDGSGWMQRALKAEAELRAAAPPPPPTPDLYELMRLKLVEVVAALHEAEAFTRAYQCVDDEEIEDWERMRAVVEKALGGADALLLRDLQQP